MPAMTAKCKSWNFRRSMIRTATKARMAGYRACKDVAAAKAEVEKRHNAAGSATPDK